MECWKDGGMRSSKPGIEDDDDENDLLPRTSRLLTSAATKCFPPGEAFYPAKLASWPQPYFIGLLRVSKLAAKLALSWPSWQENKLKIVERIYAEGRME